MTHPTAAVQPPHRIAWLAGLCLLAACNYETGERALGRGDEVRAAEVWRPLAERGDMRATLALGRLDAGLNATPDELDEAEAAFIRVLRYGEEWQQAWAHYELGQIAVRRNQGAVAADHFDVALRLGIPWAAHGLGQLLAEGRGVRRDPARAYRLTERAARAGVPPAMTAMGDLYARGIGVAADPATARSWYERGAEAGDPWGHYALAQFALADPDDPNAGLSAERAGPEVVAALEIAVAGRVPPAKRALADLLLPLDETAPGRIRPDPERAIALYEAAAAAGDGWASFRLAGLHATGRLGGEPDPVLAARLYAEARQRGVAQATTALAAQHETGVGRPVDAARAAELYAEAAAAGDVDAVLGLARLARLPDPPPIDRGRAIDDLLAAFERRPAEAGRLLGQLHLEGVLLPADPVRAAGYLEAALAAGNTNVRATLARLYLEPELDLGGAGRDAAAGRRLLEAAAAEDDPNAAFELARLLEQPPDADPARARSLYAKAAEAGVTAAQKEFADLLRRGVGGPPDLALAAVWYRAAAEGDDPWAAFELARLLESGKGVAADPAAARILYRTAAEARIVPAQQALASMLRDGRGGAVDKFGAARWYRVAADLGEPWAAYELARLYAEDREGRLPADRSRGEIMAILYRAAADAGIPQAQLALADLLADTGSAVHDPVAAADWYERAASSGEPMAAFRLARLPATPENASVDPRRRALLEAAAAAGVPGAATDLARLLESDASDLPRALELYRIAATAGDPWAALALGRHYQGDRSAPNGRTGDPERAVHWLERAAAAGIAEAERRLGDLHADPSSARHAPELAARWYASAAAAGDDWAAVELAKLQIEGPAGLVDPAAAARTLRPLADAGLPQAQKLLGDLYDRGQGVREDPATALALHREAAQAGDPWAALVMADRHTRGRDVPRDPERARELLAIAAAAGLAPAQRRLADAEMARATASPAAEAEAARAAALNWYSAAAEGGDAQALYRLALVNLEGQGVARNPERAVELLQRAAAAGSAAAGATLGDLYTLGGPVERDAERAAFWYQAAAEARARD